MILLYFISAYKFWVYELIYCSFYINVREGMPEYVVKFDCLAQNRCKKIENKINSYNHNLYADK